MATSQRPIKQKSPVAQSQWALVWREFRRRRLAVASGLMILILITMSVFAPFLANDQPICYRGVNLFEYQEAMRTLNAVMSLLAGEISEAKVEEGVDGAKVEGHKAVIRSQASLLASKLSKTQAEQFQKTVGPALEISPGPEASEQLKTIRLALRREFSSKNVTIASDWHYPVIASLRWMDIALISLNVLVLLVPIWRPLLRRMLGDGPPGRLAWSSLAFVALLPTLCALLWFRLVPERTDRTNYKTGVLVNSEEAVKAPVVYETVLWPPIPYGLDEDRLDAKYAFPALGRAFGLKPKKKSTVDAKATPWDGPHWLGTDGIGRDTLCRMIWGGRVSLAVGIVAVSIYITIGIIVGSIAGYFRGMTDLVISRIIEIVICFPSFFLILTIIAFVGPSIFNIMVVIGLTGWTGVARLVRGEFLRLGEQEFVLAGRALGYSPVRIIFRHVLPNALAPVLVSATFGIAGAILTESGLSFLGFGITVPTPSWGGILSTGRDAIFRAPWLIYFPGFAIFITITAYNLVGEALRDAADPRLRGQFTRS